MAHEPSVPRICAHSRQVVSHLICFFLHLMMMDRTYGKNPRGSGLHIALRNDDEYEESEVWDVLDDKGGGTVSSPACYIEDEPRTPIRKNRAASGVSGIRRPRRVKKKGSCDDSDVDEGGDGGYGDCELPPHEFIAKRLARSHIGSSSVMEGAGRKLKGRDLSKVRHAVLTKTGFLDPPSNLDSN